MKSLSLSLVLVVLLAACTQLSPAPPALAPRLAPTVATLSSADRLAIYSGMAHYHFDPRDKMNAVRDDGIWLGFGVIQVEGNEVRVGVKTFLNGINAVAYEYQLARQGDRWMVLKATMLWIS